MKEPFETAVEQHGATVLRVCRATLGRNTDADDAWQETFLAAMKAWPQLDEAANVEAWLVRIAQRKCIDAHRARQRRPIPTDDVPPPRHPQHTKTSDHDDEMWGAVAALPERQRQALAYHYLAGFKHTETAEILGISPEAVRRAAADGLKKLRAHFAYRMDKTERGPS